MSHIRVLQSNEDLFDLTTRGVIRDRLVERLDALRTSNNTNDQTVEDDRFLERMIQHLNDLGIDQLPDEKVATTRFHLAFERFPADNPFARGAIDADMTWYQLILDAWASRKE